MTTAELVNHMVSKSRFRVFLASFNIMALCISQIRRSVQTVTLFMLVIALPASAAVVDDWGTIVTPLDEDLTFTFEQYDIENNFTDEYTFALEGEADAIYEVTFNIDYCAYGCGNVDVTYGIYDQNGGLISEVNQDGTLLLSAGDYSFQVNGTGMGAGNSLDYFGEVTFMAVVSPAPEPPAYLLLFTGILASYLFTRRKRHASECSTTQPPEATAPGVLAS